METIEDFYEFHCRGPSDIHEHLPTLSRYASSCSHVTEMGVRTVVSTWAFLHARPRKLVSIDINPAPIEYAQRVAASNGVELQFRQADTGAEGFEIEPTELLFIDTWHVYDQLQRELRMHAARASRWIILHDTTTYADVGEGYTYECAAQPGEQRKGLWTAVEEFLARSPEWELRERYTNNNGLTVLARR
jgi:hypothetical protein